MTSGAASGPPLLPHDTRLVHLETCVSTNSEALARARAGEDLPLWVICDQQTGGRGRDGRSWSSEPGNLMASLVTPLEGPANIAPELSLVAGVAAVDAIRAAGAPIAGLRLKWPNDILIGMAKAGGILVENSPIRGGRAAVIGFGLNLERVPLGIQRDITSLTVHGVSRRPLDMLAFLAEAMHEWLGCWRYGEGFGEVRAAWLDRAGPVGEAISVHIGGAIIAGTFAGLDADGALMLKEAFGGLRRVTYGDVSVAT